MVRVPALAPKGDVLGLQAQSQAPVREHAGGNQSMCKHIPFFTLQAPGQGRALSLWVFKRKGSQVQGAAVG